MKREAKFQTVFNHWLKEIFKQSGAFELKQTISERIPFSAVKQHQVAALCNASNEQGLVYKIPDAGYQNPFDCISLVNIPAFVAIKYPKSIEVIAIRHWMEERAYTEEKSLTWKRANEISTYSIANGKQKKV